MENWKDLVEEYNNGSILDQSLCLSYGMLQANTRTYVYLLGYCEPKNIDI